MEIYIDNIKLEEAAGESCSELSLTQTFHGTYTLTI